MAEKTKTDPKITPPSTATPAATTPPPATPAPEASVATTPTAAVSDIGKAEATETVVKPTVGRIVLYKLSERDVQAISEDRGLGSATQCNLHRTGNVLPMIIVSVWPGDDVNGQVFLDGNFTLWVKTVSQGDGFGQWQWPNQQWPSQKR